MKAPQPSMDAHALPSTQQARQVRKAGGLSSKQSQGAMGQSNASTKCSSQHTALVIKQGCRHSGAHSSRRGWSRAPPGPAGWLEGRRGRGEEGHRRQHITEGFLAAGPVRHYYPMLCTLSLSRLPR